MSNPATKIGLYPEYGNQGGTTEMLSLPGGLQKEGFVYTSHHNTTESTPSAISHGWHDEKELITSRLMPYRTRLAGWLIRGVPACLRATLPELWRENR